jgi:hypothetical protein
MASFTAATGLTQTIAGTVASASITLTAVGVNNPHALISNEGTTTAFIRFGIGAQTATAADVPLLGGNQVVLNIGGANTVAAIMATGTANIYVTPGYGT